MFLICGLIGWAIQKYLWHKYEFYIRNAIRAVTALSYVDAYGLGIPQEAQGKMSIFILAGQSNMSGRGVLPDRRETHPRIFLFGNDGRWKIASEPTDNPAGQVDMVSYDFNAGLSPGMTFAFELLNTNPELYVGLVPVAKGGTSLYQWRRDFSDTTLYGSFLKRARAASVMGKIEGFLWFQGEADARNPADKRRKPVGEKWGTQFKIFVENLRKDLGRPDLPVVFAQIGRHKNPETYPHWDKVKASQKKVELPVSAIITTEDLELRDRVHFSAESTQKIGKRFAIEYQALTERK